LGFPEPDPAVEDPDGTSFRGGGPRILALPFLAVLGAFGSQFVVFPVLPPLARELGLSESQLGLVITLAAVAVFVFSPAWGRRSDAWGRKPVLVAGLLGSALALYAFAVVSQLGLSGALSVPALLALMLATRGVLFGVALSAVPVAAQAHVADLTSGERERTRGIAAMGAAQGLALVLGPAVGGLLAGVLGLLGPLYFAPSLVLLTAVLVWLLLPAPQRRRAGEAPPRLSPLDGRAWPFLVVGFGLFLSLSVVQITIGFLFQDRLRLSAEETAQAVGLGLFVAGLVLVLAQAILVPGLGWPPLKLMRSGMPVVAAGLATLALAQSFAPMAAGLALVGMGLGLAIPGYTTAPTLLVRADEQGGVAGLIAATNALTFVFGPLVGTALYELGPSYPYVVGALLISALFVFVLMHPSVRQAPEKGLE
jgi:MFS transporter, DHA1 family, tetracycline resistance protein